MNDSQRALINILIDILEHPENYEKMYIDATLKGAREKGYGYNS
jgi:hypothetical protein